jgi:hypothetical protein
MEVIAAYDAAWNEPDPDARRQLVEQSFAEDGELIGPRGRFAGRQAPAKACTLIRIEP